jgi:hypothetical protein
MLRDLDRPAQVLGDPCVAGTGIALIRPDVGQSMEVVVDRLDRRELPRQEGPLAARANHREDAIEDLPALPFAGTIASI